MEYRTLGKTGLRTSILGTGAFHYLEISTAEVHALLNRYLDAGGNYLETAAQYGGGEAEMKMAGVVAARRDEFVLTTKCHLRDREGAAETIDASLRRLRTDHVDILLMHHVQLQDDLDRILSDDGALRAAEDARRAGKVRFIGISNHGHPEMVIQALERYPLDVIMTGFNYYDCFNFPLIEAKLLPMAVERGVGIIGMKALADGYLWRSAEKALRYAWSLPIGTLALGWNTMELLEQDLAWAEAFTPLTDVERQQLFMDAPELGNYVCRLCDKCLPCPEGIDIPRLFELEGIYDRQMWDGVVRDPADFALRNRLRFWFEYNDKRARAAYAGVAVKADACTNCGDCEPRCPYGLPIVRKLRHTHAKLVGLPVLY
jgi:predicted aldo/keto reductase-like oxidoreductase